MSKSVRISQEEAARRVAAAGYVLESVYTGRHFRISVRCDKHNASDSAAAKHIFAGMKITCCASAARREAAERLRETMKGSKNPFYGKRHSIEAREKMSAAVISAPHALRGKPMPRHIAEALQRANCGKQRPKFVCEKLSRHMKSRHESFPFLVRKAETGKTAGKAGIFYIVRIGGLLKFGSATTTMRYRLTRLRQRHGEVELLLYCIVADAGQYEAIVMRANQDRWVRGEYFRDLGVAA